MKKIKDPIYGYIEIDEKFLPIIDSAYFQRLRNVIQTSYTAIYPSSLHNRFTHSLGVYNLGKLSFDCLINNSTNILKQVSQKQIQKIKDAFVLACLCHDLGHSPFSHTGEKFYNKKLINEKLKTLINDSSYNNDLEAEGGIVGKEHEIMSALLTLQVFKRKISKDLYGFFARCIIGLQYKDSTKNNPIDLLKKACIEILNSDIIDVDKLDYLIRDSYMSGYSSVSIDYNRLLFGISINDRSGYPICYNKGSLSVLESVLTAHDMERRWVQSHPIVLYESFLLQTIIRELNTKYKASSNKELFSLESLTSKGIKIKKLGKLCLLSDADILFLAKQLFDSSAVKEYFDRTLRRHPIWKSEAEYMHLFYDFNKNKEFIEILQNWEELLANGQYGVYSLNDTFYEALKKELERVDTLNINKKESEGKTLNNKRTKIVKELKLLNEIRTYFVDNNIPFDIVIISLKRFKSNIYKKAFKNLPILFEDESFDPVEMYSVTHIPLDTLENKDFFYLYYRRENKSQLNIEEFSKVLRKAAII